jgi:imidazolonepropionase-like amidohydrolase
MRRHIRCGKLFTSTDDTAASAQTIIVEDGRIDHVGPTDAAPAAAPADEVIDHGDCFVMPGLTDIHVHLSYGNARTEEDIDLFSPVEYRALRGLYSAQRVLKAGFTSIADPATTGVVSLAIRDAIESGMFVGPRVTTSGRQITNRQGLSDWYPTFIGVPDTNLGVLARTAEEGIAEIRKQAKEGVDFYKIAVDGDAMNPATGLISGYTQDEMNAMVTEAHRLGKKVVVHARGAEATLYSARAGADVILHASWMDDEGLEAVVKNGCALCPTLSLIINDIEFTRPTDGCYPNFPDAHKRELEAGQISLSKAREAGVQFLLGTDCGFAVTPYGEWNARELEYYVDYLGFSPAAALRSATQNNSSFVNRGEELGTIEVGNRADILVVDGDPLADVRVLQDKTRIRQILLDGKPVEIELNDDIKTMPLEKSYNMWSDVYTQARVAELDGRTMSTGKAKLQAV